MSKYKFSSTQFNLPPAIAGAVRMAASRIPEFALHENGREDDPHVTVKYGLHSEDPEPVRHALADQGQFKIRLGKTSSFPDSGDGDVVKAEVESEELHKLHRKVAESGPHTTSHRVYRPHVTIAYVKPGLGPVMAQRDGDSLNGKEATVDHVMFSGRDGKKSRIPLKASTKDVLRRLSVKSHS